jgi:hypothetical protein
VNQALSAVVPWQLRAWPIRRRVAALVMVGPLAITHATLGPPLATPWAAPATLWCAIPAALLLAGYVPLLGSGRRLDVGCAPCAAVSGLVALGSLMLRAMAPLEPGIAAAAGLLTVFGLLQRLTADPTCPMPGR